VGRARYNKYTRRALYVNYTLSIKGTTYLSSYKYASSYKCTISCTVLLNAVAKSIPYATRCSAWNVYLAQNAAKCCKNAGKFFPDVFRVKSYFSLFLINGGVILFKLAYFKNNRVVNK
jgi:hypothetical protein